MPDRSTSSGSPADEPSLTIKSGSRARPPLHTAVARGDQNGEIDPPVVSTYRTPLPDAAKGYDIFGKKENCDTVVLTAEDDGGTAGQARSAHRTTRSNTTRRPAEYQSEPPGP